MCSGHVLPRMVGCDSRTVAETDSLPGVIFSKPDITLRNVAMCQRFDSETKSGARVYALILRANELMKLISGQMELRIYLPIVLVFHVGLNLGFARNLSWYRRKSWLNLLVVQKSTKDLGRILFDLIPPVADLQLIKNELSDSKVLLKSGNFRVVALQLDLCGFTKLSSSLRPASPLLGRNVFKVDTIGDAYIVVGWLHRSSSQKAYFGGSGLTQFAYHERGCRGLRGTR
jgi:hypothetical protein